MNNEEEAAPASSDDVRPSLGRHHAHPTEARHRRAAPAPRTWAGQSSTAIACHLARARHVFRRPLIAKPPELRRYRIA